MKEEILYFGGFDLPDNNAASHRVISIAKILEKLDYKIYLVGQSRNLENVGIKYNLSNNIKGFNRKYPQNIQENIRWVITGQDVIEIISKRKKKNEVSAIILYNYPAFASHRIKKYCDQNNIKVLGDITEWYSTKGLGLVKKVVKFVDVEYRMKHVNKRMDGLIVISDFLEEYYSQTYLEKIINIPPLVDKKETKWNIKVSKVPKLRVVYAGSPGIDKDNIEKVIEIFKKIKCPSELLVIGIDKQYFDDSEIDVSGLDIKILGRVDHEKNLSIVSTADFFMFFRDENLVNLAGFPTKIVEATSLKIPVITNEIGTQVNYFEDNNIIYIDDLEDINIITKSYSRKIKKNINENQFDYRKYQENMKMFLDNIFSENVNN